MNKNIIMLARLYDSTSKDLENALAAQTISLNDSRIVDKVKWLGEIAKTLSLVYQIESMRVKSTNKDASKDLTLPEEQVVEDPALKKAQKGQFKANNTSTDLDQFKSPGGWKPF